MGLIPKPDEWLFVIPAKLTPGERAFVTGLVQPSGPKITILDVVELNNLMINFPDVYNYLERDQMRANAILYGQERQSLFHGASDLMKRVHDLGKLADTTDLYWGVDFARSGNRVSYSMRPKTQDAHNKRPIELTVAGEFGHQHAEIRNAFRNTFGFGASDPIVLPADTVRTLKIVGPEFIAGTHCGVEVMINPISLNSHIGAPAQLAFEGLDGSARGQFEGEISHIGHGSEGGAIELSFYDDHLQVRILFPTTPEGGPADVRIGYHLRKVRPSDAVEVLEISRLLRSTGVMKVFLDDIYLMSMRQDDPKYVAEMDPEIDIIQAIARDLMIVQAHCRQSFQLPETLSASERIDLRVARLLIEGHAVESPSAPGLTATLSGVDSPELRALLTEGASLRFEGPEYQFTLGRKIMRVGQVYVADPETHAADSREAIKALDGGKGEGLEVQLVPGTGAYFRCILVDHAKPEHFTQPPTPWGIVDITQPKKDT